jgi:hypothetical protein
MHQRPTPRGPTGRVPEAFRACAVRFRSMTSSTSTVVVIRCSTDSSILQCFPGRRRRLDTDVGQRPVQLSPIADAMGLIQ